MQVTGGQPVTSPWDIPGTAHREAPTPPGPPPMTVGGRTAPQAVSEAQRQQPRGDTLSEQIFRGIVGVNDHPEDAQALDVFDALADQLVEQHQA